ncbi:Dihydropyrimidinase @ D-hydantoinase [hydrothermal vent metagenome]|uniref:Dihydropyrimidinase @ D-hydantoinase n=1 Tax=hydrothermal vent metagenome TaxID=652676 RepID=A0A3B1D1U9_9ZZZZ
MPILITGGRIITATDDYTADIYCEGESITHIEPGIDASTLPAETECIDAAGKLIFPGFIDPHVHIHLPFMGTNACDDYETASKAALAGGTTTLIEMICPGPTDEPLAAFEEWRSKAAPLAAVDYSFHMSVVRFDDLAREQLTQIATTEGIPSFKVFLAYKGALDLSDEDLFGMLSMAKDLGVIVTAHCENAEAIDAMQKRLLAEGKTGPEWHEPSRPTAVEADGLHHLATMAELTGAHIYTVHTSCEPAVRAALDARLRGVNIWIEAVLPHLVLDKTYAELPKFEGAKYVMSPPLREKRHQAVLWGGLAGRSISTIGTDHAPFNFHGQKDMGKKAFTAIPNGIPSIQERPALVYTHGVRTGRLDLHAFVDACSTQAARIFGMYPRKGDIRVGADADLVVWDPDYTGTLSVATSHSAIDYNAFEGWPVQGRASVVFVRGQTQAREGEFVGTLGRGQLIRRQPTHF